MGRSISAKKRLRKVQKAKKRKKYKLLKLTQGGNGVKIDEGDSSIPERSITTQYSIGSGEQDIQDEALQCSEAINIGEDTTMADIPTTHGIRNTTIIDGTTTTTDRLEKKLQLMTERVNFYQWKLRQEQLKTKKTMDWMYKDSNRAIKSVREFWKEKIYNESTRAGKILKTSMQNRN